MVISILKEAPRKFQMMNKVPGLYLLQLKDVKGARYNLKFTIK
jgi:hypothetical protein